MTDIFQYFLNGLSQGSIYALVALGYTMVYGVIRLINFAHGEFFMIGAFTGLFCLEAGFSLLLTFPIAMIVSGATAVLVEKIVYRPIRKTGNIPSLITALGASLFFQYSGQSLLGARPRAFPQVFRSESLDFKFFSLTSLQLVLFSMCFILMLGLWLFVRYTKIGKAMRATSFNREAAELMGINTDNIISLTFFIGASLAGAAGVLIGMYYNSIDPLMGVLPGLKAFTAAVLGGIGIIPGAMLGGFILGISENLVTGLLSSSYRDAVAFFILILLLLIRPNGILGKQRKEKV